MESNKIQIMVDGKYTCNNCGYEEDLTNGFASEITVEYIKNNTVNENLNVICSQCKSDNTKLDLWIH